MGISINNAQKELIITILNSFKEKYTDFPEFSPGKIEDYKEEEQNPLFTVDYGASKLVLIPSKKIKNELPYVIKFPLTYSDSEEEYYKINYCEEEFNISERARDWKLDYMFAPIGKIGTYEGNEVYIQPIVDCTKRVIRKEAYTILSNLKVPLISFVSPELGLNIYEYYGEDKYRKMICFVQENNINDLHGGNFGYINGAPVIFDYSGYRGLSTYTGPSNSSRGSSSFY